MKHNIFSILMLIFACSILIAYAGDSQPQAIKSVERPGTTGKTVSVANQPKAGEKIEWQVLSSGGTSGSSTSFKLNGTVSQTAIGPGTSTNFKLNSGFWQNFAAFVCDCKPGDANASGTFNALDVTYLINYLYKHGAAPKPYAICSGDANGNCGINALDVTFLINFLYKHGSAPGDCATWVSHCGMPLRSGQ